MTDPRRDSDAGSGPPEWTSPEATVLRRVPGGPALVRGPVRVTGRGGRVVISDRVVVAVCRCGRSSIHPLCDTSHRRAACSSDTHCRPVDSGDN